MVSVPDSRTVGDNNNHKRVAPRCDHAGILLVGKTSRRSLPANPAVTRDSAEIIVLGGAFQPVLAAYWDQPQVNGHAERLIAFIALARKYANLQRVFSGGAAAFGDQLPTESNMARELFASVGMDTSRIVFENRSRNTCENAIYTAQLVKPIEQQTWVLITSAMHMARAVGAFRKAGFRVLPYQVDYTTYQSALDFAPADFLPTVVRNLDRLDYAVHEWLGLLGYRLFGCSDTLFPGSSQ